jgi:hypothetical protein
MDGNFHLPTKFGMQAGNRGISSASAFLPIPDYRIIVQVDLRNAEGYAFRK